MARAKQLSPTAAELPIVSSSFTPEMVAELKARAMKHLAEVQGFECETAEEEALAAEGIAAIAATKKEIDATRKAFLVPINAEHDRVHTPFKEGMDLCDSAREILDKAVGRRRLREAAEQRAALAAATAAVKVNDTAALTTALQGVEAAAPRKLEGVSVIAKWEASVIAPELLLPAWTKTVPNFEKIDAHASACPPDREPDPIPGVRFTLVTSTRVSGKRA